VIGGSGGRSGDIMAPSRSTARRRALVNWRSRPDPFFSDGVSLHSSTAFFDPGQHLDDILARLRGADKFRFSLALGGVMPRGVHETPG